MFLAVRLAGFEGLSAMAISNKWMATDGRDASARAVAVRVIRSRLDAVWALLPEASSERQHRVEHVHQLRVATRRSLVALEIFSDLVPAGRREWFERMLRQIRRTAGEARDLDVLTERLMEPVASGAGRHKHEPHAADSRRRRRLVEMLVRQRKASRRPIRELYESLMDGDWPTKVQQLLDRTATGRRVSFSRHVSRQFEPIVKQFFKTSDRRLRDAEELHALRIQGKKLRYALEICGSVFKPKVRSRCYAALEQLQERLGEFTDHAAAADRFRRWGKDKAAKASREALRDLRREEARLADEARRSFTKWWTPSRRKSLRRRFERTLRR